MSIWQAFGLWVLVAMAITILLPVLAVLGWEIYVRLTPAGQTWNAWLNREMARIKKQERHRHSPRNPDTLEQYMRS